MCQQSQWTVVSIWVAQIRPELMSHSGLRTCSALARMFPTHFDIHSEDSKIPTQKAQRQIPRLRILGYRDHIRMPPPRRSRWLLFGPGNLYILHQFHPSVHIASISPSYIAGLNRRMTRSNPGRKRSPSKIWYWSMMDLTPEGT